MKNNVSATNKKKMNATLTKAIPSAVTVESGTDFPEELLNKKVEDITPEEIAFMHDSNEHFTGKEINPKKVAAYQELLALAAQLEEKCDQYLDMIRSDPDKHKKTAMICIDLSVYPHFNKETATILSKMFALSDDVMMAQIPNGGHRISFDVQRIWLR